MQSVPRPIASVSLGGSLRASRAAQLARPRGPLAAVDLADGRALTVRDLGAGWVACPDGGETAALSAPAPAPSPASAPAPRRRRRLGTALLLAAALGAAVVTLAAGFSGAPAPAVAGPTLSASAPRRVVALPHRHRAARGGRASALPRPRRAPAATPAPVRAPPVVAPPVAPPPEPPPLPVLPPAPSL
ncbi:MAG TPA: hypothetical protein VFD90_18305 [Gaiellales bacterium]|nr:hypothetical protein [Gaiellales bacterium]